jgi:hypothetical protein
VLLRAAITTPQPLPEDEQHIFFTATYRFLWARAHKNRKGSVENAIQHTQSTALKGKRYSSIDEQNEFLEHWENTWAAQRIHGSAKRQVEAMFQEERPHLRALPLQGFQYFTEATHTVCDDSCVRVDHSSYAARPVIIGTHVLVRLFEHHLESRDLCTQSLLRTHTRVDCRQYHRSDTSDGNFCAPQGTVALRAICHFL